MCTGCPKKRGTRLEVDKVKPKAWFKYFKYWLTKGTLHCWTVYCFSSIKDKFFIKIYWVQLGVSYHYRPSSGTLTVYCFLIHIGAWIWPFLLSELFCGTPPSCLKVIGMVGGFWWVDGWVGVVGGVENLKDFCVSPRHEKMGMQWPKVFTLLNGTTFLGEQVLQNFFTLFKVVFKIHFRPFLLNKALSTRILMTSWMSLVIMLTTLALMGHRLVGVLKQ